MPTGEVGMPVNIVFNGQGGASGFTEAIVAPIEGTDPPEDNLYWHPMLPLGKFTHPAYGDFETTSKDAHEMIANFESGLPGPKGIPIDQDGLHAVRGAGAYGWIKSLELRDDDILWMGIQWTEDGIEAVSSNKLPYVSPYWQTSKQAHQTYGTNNLVIAVALCTRPFFHDQPELQVAASEFTRVTDTGIETTTGGSLMADLAIDAREKYETANEKLTDEQWAELTDGFDEDKDWDEFITSIAAEVEVKAKADAEAVAEAKAKADADKTSAELLAQAQKEKETAEEKAAEAEKELAEATGKLEVAEKTIGDVTERVSVLEGERDEMKAREELAATDLGSNLQYAPAAIDLLVTQRLTPSAESAAAIEAHMVENGGKMATVPVGEYPNLTAVAATTGDLSDEDWWKAKQAEIPADTIAATEEIAQTQKVGLKVAYGMYHDGNSA